MTSPVAFKQSFSLGQWHHQRLTQSPGCELIAGAHREIRDDAIGKLHMDSFAANNPPLRLFARLYHVQSGAFAWYSVTKSEAATPAKADETNSPALTPTSGNQENDVQPTSGGSNE